MTQDELFMQRAIELAALGTGQVSPNPKVGCVIVRDNKIIGEGWHQSYGQPHAEVNAVNSVHDASLLNQSTVYVNLEPCSHFGKTPPCADLLIKSRVRKVFIANIDTNPLVSGQGVKKLTGAGIEVETGVLEKGGWELNKRFFTSIKKMRPYIILKWAQTADGFIANQDFDSRWISNEFSRQLVHRWRSEEDAVLVGTATAAHDDPQLNVRDWTGRDPIRIVVDRFLRLPLSLKLFDRTQETICYNLLKSDESSHLQFVRLDETDFVQSLLRDLHSKQIQSLIVEGGAKTHQLFIDSENWDEARIFCSQKRLGTGIAAPLIKGPSQVQQIFSDELQIIRP